MSLKTSVPNQRFLKVLVTGGLGYIGSHTVIQLLESDYEVIVLDNLSNSKYEVISRLEKMSGKKIKVYIGDLQNENVLSGIFGKDEIDFVIHFAGLKAVKESVENPLMYYENNVSATVTLLNTMKKFGVRKLIFSSSATVYGNNAIIPLSEESQTGKDILSPYGKTKYLIEEILKDLKDWNIVILRYFNPIGCHPSGLIGEDPKGTPNNLFPYILKVVKGDYSHLQIFGNDYITRDGTCIRDYIHVEDLAIAHLSSIKKLDDKGVHIYNVGTGNGYSVLEVVHTFEKVNGVKIPVVMGKRREGDSTEIFADTTKIETELGWKAQYTLDDMCRDGYNFINGSEDLNKSIYLNRSEEGEDDDDIQFDITDLEQMLDECSDFSDSDSISDS